MDAVGVTIVSESARIAGVTSTLVIGELTDEAQESLPGSTSTMSARELLACHSSEAPQYDLVICAGEKIGTELERRALGHAIARTTRLAAIAVQQLGLESPIPLIELKRGLLLDAPELGYRVYGKRGGEQ